MFAVEFERETVSIIIVTTETGESLTIPPGSRLEFIRDLQDWRRVAVRWKRETVIVSRTAWLSSRAIS